jgi:PAS domain-containing protein
MNRDQWSNSKVLVVILLSVRKMEVALQEAHDELEMKVQERTLQLKQINEQLRAKITEQIRTEQALRESENYYQAIFENTGAATMIIEEDLTISMVDIVIPSLHI